MAERTDWAGIAIGGVAIGVGILIVRAMGKKTPPPPPPPPGLATLYGQVTSGGSPVAGATISIAGDAVTHSDATGNYTVADLDLGTAPVGCSMAGYVAAVQNITLVEGNNRLDFVLTPIAPPPPPPPEATFMCYNDGLKFTSQALLDAHVQAVHPNTMRNPGFLINTIRWGGNSITRTGQALVGSQEGTSLYVLSNNQAPRPWSGGSTIVSIDTFNLWAFWDLEIAITAQVGIGQFGTIGASPFHRVTTLGMLNPPLLDIGQNAQRPGDSAKLIELPAIPNYAEVGAALPRGTYDAEIWVKAWEPSAGIQRAPRTSFRYVILDAWII